MTLHQATVRFLKLAMELSDVQIDDSGMRPESYEMVERQRQEGTEMRPIEVSIYPGESPVLTDGRHRLAVARRRGDQQISALVRWYDQEGSVVKKKLIELKL